jgi:trehalose 6-phosphate phosphatase
VNAASLVAVLAAAPESAALLFDVDGTLAPIAPRPELACVPEETRVELCRLAGRYRLIACLSGRSRDDAAALVRVEGVRVVGNHGIELHPDAERAQQAIAAFRRRVNGRWPIDDKGLSLAFHYREVPDEEAARAALRTLAAEAEAAGLDPRWGRKVLEVRPRLEADKGTAARALLAESAVRLGLYAGDDTTDLDAFRGLRESGLERAFAVAVASPEAPTRLLEEADLVVEGPAGLLDLLRQL